MCVKACTFLVFVRVCFAVRGFDFVVQRADGEPAVRADLPRQQNHAGLPPYLCPSLCLSSFLLCLIHPLALCVLQLMANSFARNIGCALADANCMRSKTSAQVLAAQLKVCVGLYFVLLCAFVSFRCLHYACISLCVLISQTDVDPLSFGSLFLAFQPWTPYVDGKFIKKQTLQYIQQGEYAKNVPVLIGTVRNEAFVYVYEVRAVLCVLLLLFCCLCR